MSSTQATLRAQQRSMATMVAQYLRELSAPRDASGPDQGSVGVIPNGARPAEAAP
jgi:hypothetical protein